MPSLAPDPVAKCLRPAPTPLVQACTGHEQQANRLVARLPPRGGRTRPETRAGSGCASGCACASNSSNRAADEAGFEGAYDCLMCFTSCRGQPAMHGTWHVACAAGTQFQRVFPQCGRESVVASRKRGRFTTLQQSVECVDLVTEDEAAEEEEEQEGGGAVGTHPGCGMRRAGATTLCNTRLPKVQNAVRQRGDRRRSLPDPGLSSDFPPDASTTTDDPGLKCPDG